MGTSLLPNELAAKTLVIKIGNERATRLLELLTARIRRRINVGNSKSFGQFLDESCVRKSQWEVDLIFNLKMGLSLTDTYNTPAAARERLLKRVAERNQRRLEKI